MSSGFPSAEITWMEPSAPGNNHWPAPSRVTLPEMIGSIDGVEWGVLFAASTVQLVPVLIFVAVTHRYLVAGLTAGATKG